MRANDPIPDELREFRQELKHHPKLYKICQEDCVSFSEVLAEAAAYVGIVVDGAYSEGDMKGLMKSITRELKGKRKKHLIALN